MQQSPVPVKMAYVLANKIMADICELEILKS
jgi:hypothetical protein